MKVEYGIWEISTGKGDRMYINCTDNSVILHPDQLCGLNGLGLYYGFENLKDLAITILKFEKLVNESNSIISKV